MSQPCQQRSNFFPNLVAHGPKLLRWHGLWTRSFPVLPCSCFDARTVVAATQGYGNFENDIGDFGKSLRPMLREVVAKFLHSLDGFGVDSS